MQCKLKGLGRSGSSGNTILLIAIFKVRTDIMSCKTMQVSDVPLY